MRQSTASDAGSAEPETFAFLEEAFTFICGKSRQGSFQLHRKTRRDRMRAKLKDIKAELRRRMHQPIPYPGSVVEAGCDRALRLLRGPNQQRGAFSVPAHYVTDLWRRTLRRRSRKTASHGSVNPSSSMSGFPSRASFTLGPTCAAWDACVLSSSAVAGAAQCSVASHSRLSSLARSHMHLRTDTACLPRCPCEAITQIRATSSPFTISTISPASSFLLAAARRPIVLNLTRRAVGRDGVEARPGCHAFLAESDTLCVTRGLGSGSSARSKRPSWCFLDTLNAAGPVWHFVVRV